MIFIKRHRLGLGVVVVLAFAEPALAHTQSSTNCQYGMVIRAADVKGAFGTGLEDVDKPQIDGSHINDFSGGQMFSPVNSAPPSGLVGADVWTTTSGTYAQIAGLTYKLVTSRADLDGALGPRTVNKAAQTSSDQVQIILPSLAPAQTVPGGSVAKGAIYTANVRSGGYGAYGDWLNLYTVKAATPAPQFDTAITAWAANENLTGGAIFGGWFAAVSPSKALGETYSGGRVTAMEINAGNRWGDFGLLADEGAPFETNALNVVPDVGPAADGVNAFTVTISNASPAVVTLVGHAFTANMGVVFNGPGLPAGLVAGQAYYVLAAGLTTTTFEFSQTIGGAPIFAPGGSSGPVTVTPSWPGSFGIVYSHSNWGHQWWTAETFRYDTIHAGGIGLNANGGSVPGDAPGWLIQVNGYWSKGIDFSAATLSGPAIELGSSQNVAWNGDTCLTRGPAGGQISLGNCASGDRSGGLYLYYVNAQGGGDFRGNLTARRIDLSASVRITPTTVAGLATTDPTPEAGDRAFVADAVACTFGVAVKGGGSLRCPIYYDSGWKAG